MTVFEETLNNLLGEYSEEIAWKKEGACRGIPTEMFYSPIAAECKIALTVCEKCTVIDKCLHETLLFEKRYAHRDGVSGGTTAKQRDEKFGTIGRCR